jgi:hypothetical protein
LARSNEAVRALLFGGLLAGALDITAAFVIFGRRGATPLEVLQSVASGLLGRAAYEGGWATGFLGGALHFLIASGAAAVFVAASRHLTLLVRHPMIWGPLYGIAVYLLMNLVVLPLSAVPPRPFTPNFVMIVVHMLCVGLPIALVASRYMRRA